MDDPTETVVAEILQERKLQIGRWGNTADDRKSYEHWGNILGAYVGRVQTAIHSRCEKPTDEAALRYMEIDDATMRTDAIKVATICVAFAEALDRRRARDSTTRRACDCGSLDHTPGRCPNRRIA